MYSQYTTDVITTETATLNLAQQRVEILPDTMGWEDALEDGIYFINVEQTNEDGSVVSETECLFVDCHTKCDIFSYLAKYPEGSALDLSHAALSYMNDCSDCKCEDGCTIFNHIIATLSDPTIKMKRHHTHTRAQFQKHIQVRNTSLQTEKSMNNTTRVITLKN